MTSPCQTYDFRPRTGETIWNSNSGCDGDGGATGVVANGRHDSPNGVATYGGAIFSTDSGRTSGPDVADNMPAIGSQTGYFPQRGTLRAVDDTSKTILWRFAGDASLTSSPLLINGYVSIGGSSGNLYVLDAATGAQLQVAKLSSAIPKRAGWFPAFPFCGMSAG